MTCVTRFAPSPTGFLHLGHAYSALFAARAAAGGPFLVRIEDIDPARCRPAFILPIFEDLHWLGLSWPEPVRVQSEHGAEYAAALQRLHDLDVIYPCFCSRADIAAEIGRSGHAPHKGELMLYPGTCRALPPEERAQRTALGHPFALRLDVNAALALTGPLFWHDRNHGSIKADPGQLGDVVLARKDAPASYHLCVTLDDAAQGVTLVTRGEDLFTATHTHRLLQAVLGLPSPDYHHHALLRGADGRRLAKRDGATTIQTLRAQGQTPAAVRALAGFAD